MRRTRSRPVAPSARLSRRRLALVAAVLIVVAGLAVAFRDTLSFETLRDNREALLAWRDENYLQAVLAYVLAYIGVVTLSLPGGAVMTMTGGFLFGLIPGTVLAVIGASIGATLIFLAARAGFGGALRARIAGDPRLARLEAGLRDDAFNYLLAIRLVPAFPFFVVNIVPALLGIPLRTYLGATALGIIPGTAVYAWIGAGLGEVFARGETPDLGLIFDPVILGPLLALAALAALPAIIRRVRGRGVGE